MKFNKPKYNDLPKTIISPITGDVLRKIPGNNDVKLYGNSQVTFIRNVETGMKVAEPHVAMYYNPATEERIYIPFEL